jgi:hypothetical protein
MSDRIEKRIELKAPVARVWRARVGRDSLYEFRPKPIDSIKGYLDHVSRQWYEALGRLKSLVER